CDGCLPVYEGSFDVHQEMTNANVRVSLGVG
ncbi:MAG: hypothetical protein ACJA0I_001710, partial [Gammaproteobacteria bacterium]